MEFLGRWWHRVLAVDPALPANASLLLGVLALGLVLAAWRWVRVLTTICHEAGHAVTALVTGRRLQGIRVHADTSGLTLSKGRPTGPGMVATLLAGYPAAAALWLIVVLLAVMLFAMRNLYGGLIVLAVGALVAVTSWYAPGPVLPWVAQGIAWLLLVAGPRPVLELVPNRRPGSDAAQLAALTRVPRLLWVAFWLAATLGALAAGVTLLLSR